MRYVGNRASLLVLSVLAAPISGHPFPGQQPSITPVSTGWVREGLIGLGPRQEHSVALIDDTIYIVGGVIVDDTYPLITTGRVETFDTKDHRWSVPAPLPRPINHVNLASVEGRLYSFGGLASQGLEDPVWRSVPEGNKYDPNADAWTLIAPMPGLARGSSVVGVYGSVVYIAGGMSMLNTTDGSQDALRDVSSYDTKTDTWNEDFPQLPGPRQHAGGTVINGILYVIGGRVEIKKHYNTVFALRLDHPDAWEQKAPMPTSRGGLACSALYNRYIVCAGGEGDVDAPLGVFKEVEMYDTELDQWTQLPPMEVARHGTAAVTVGNSVYIPGGGIISGGADAPRGTGGIFDYLLFDDR